MKNPPTFSLALIASCAGALLFAGACGKSTTADGTGAGGATGSGGATTGSGGATGSGGSSAVVPGSGGRTAGGVGGSTPAGSGGSLPAASGGSGSGGRSAGAGGIASGGATGTAGVTGAGGMVIPDAGNRDGRAGFEVGGPRDTAADAPAPSPDTGASAGADGGCVPNYSCTPVSPNTGNPYADCVARVNQFRACVCLPPLAQWTAGQACADQDAQYDSTQNTAHAGAQANICDWGNAQDECPDWTRSTPESVIDGCLQMMFDEGPPPAGACTGTCYSAHGHYINMTGTGYKSGVACGFYTTSTGSVWAAQNFK